MTNAQRIHAAQHMLATERMKWHTANIRAARALPANIHPQAKCVRCGRNAATHTEPAANGSRDAVCRQCCTGNKLRPIACSCATSWPCSSNDVTPRRNAR